MVKPHRLANRFAASFFLMLCVMGFFAILSSTMSKTLLNPFATILQTPTDWSGFIGAASTIPGILVSLPASSLSDIYGRKKFLLIAGFVFASAPFLYLFITTWWQLALVRFYHGFATAIFVPVAEASMAEMFPTKRGERISLFTSATYVGRGIAPFLGGYILLATAKNNDPLYNYHIMYLAVGTAGFAAFIMALLFLAERKQPMDIKQRNPTETLKQLYRGWGIVAKNRAVLMVSFIQASLYYSYGTVEYFLSGYLKDNLHFDYFSTAAVMGSLIALAILARSYMGMLSDRIGRRPPIIVGLIICAIPLVAIPFFSDLPTLLLLALIYGFGFATATASIPALVTELSPKELSGTSTGFLDSVMDIGQTVGPIISGFVLGTYLHYYGLFPSLSILLLFACTIFVLSRVASNKSTRSPR
jgi:MFS family permease